MDVNEHERLLLMFTNEIQIIKEIKVLLLCFNLCLSVIVSRVHLHPCPFLQINVDFHLSTLKLCNLDYRWLEYLT
jgi:hypothetical protein